MDEAYQPLIPNDYATCQICRDIWLQLTESAPKDNVLLGCSKEILAGSCLIHTLLFEKFFASIDDQKLEGCKDIGFRDKQDRTHRLTESVSKGGLYMDLQLVKSASVPDLDEYGRILDPDWVDIQFLKECRANCLENHGKECINPMKLPVYTPMILVDVQQRCLVSGHGAGPYVALSYVWGELTATRRTNVPFELLHILQKEHGLDSPEAAPYLSPVVRRAMALTALLGERWLWVDALCVPLGDIVTMAEQINMMGAIFARAEVTIISADGDSNNGLKGLRGISLPRNLNQKVIPFGRERIIVTNHRNSRSRGGDCGYGRRAWTYQEEKMSSRQIWLTDEFAIWVCQNITWYEDTTRAKPINRDCRGSHNGIPGFPDHGSIECIVSDYNIRELPYPEDCIQGLQGLFTHFSRGIDGGFLCVSRWIHLPEMGSNEHSNVYGIPETHFDRCLGWSPCWGHTDLKRRKRSSRPTTACLGPSDLPSWSWVGWKGLVDAESRYNAMEFNSRLSNMAETIPITTWYTSDSLSDIPRREIKAKFLREVSKYKEADHPFSPGWSRIDTPRTNDWGEPILYPDGCGEFLYSHVDILGKQFHHPFPVLEVTETTPPCMPPQTAYLFCETTRTWLHARPREWPLGSEMENYKMDLADDNGDSVGFLHLHGEEQLDLLKRQPTSSKDPSANRVEVVAINKRRQYSHTFDEQLKRYDLPLVKQNLFVVLWVEWIDGVAYRLGIGRVYEEAWRRLALQDVSLVLG